MLRIMIDDATEMQLCDALLARHQKLTNIVFHVHKDRIEAWFHFREDLGGGKFSAPSYEVCAVKKADPTCSEG